MHTHTHTLTYLVLGEINQNIFFDGSKGLVKLGLMVSGSESEELRPKTPDTPKVCFMAERLESCSITNIV